MTTTKDTSQIKSRYFNYNELSKSRGHIASEYIKGWNGLYVVKFAITKGKDLWSNGLPATGSALPLVYNTSSERWLFIVAGGRRSPKYRSINLVTFRQKLN